MNLITLAELTHMDVQVRWMQARFKTASTIIFKNRFCEKLASRDKLLDRGRYLRITLRIEIPVIRRYYASDKSYTNTITFDTTSRTITSHIPNCTNPYGNYTPHFNTKMHPKFRFEAGATNKKSPDRGLKFSAIIQNHVSQL